MNYNILYIIILFLSIIQSSYNVQNAFPNLSFQDPVGIHHSGDGSNRIFVLEQEGRIKVFNNNPNILNAQTFLDIRSTVDQDGGYTEEGLLGLAFHPNYNENGYFYVHYTDHLNGNINSPRNIISRFSVNSNNPNQANINSEEIILIVNQPYHNHNGGQMGFGPDGYLYISFGDGGSAGDPQGNGQNLSTLLGSIIRIDVDNPSNGLNYGIPPDNPFIAPLNARDEIYAYGLRNVWKFSWDLETGFLWAADVGQNAWEEIDIISSGLNYGWNEMEANHCYPPGSNCNPNNFESPIWEYELYVDGVCSVTGGYVYRGDALWMLEGQYIYGDWCTGDIWALNYDDDFGITINTSLLQSGINITSFGLDENNELLFCGNGNIYKLTSDLGDLNQDQQINILDIVLLVNLVLDNGYSEIADINNDNIVNILDVIQLLNVILD